MIKFNIGGASASSKVKAAADARASAFGDDDDDENDRNRRKLSLLSSITINDDNNEDKSADKTEKSIVDDNSEDQESADLQSMMGFGTFGRIEKSKPASSKSQTKINHKPTTDQKNQTTANREKVAKRFDVDDLMTPHLKKIAEQIREKSSESSEESSEDDDSDREGEQKESKKEKTASTSIKNDDEDEDDDDDDMIGPPLPPGFSLEQDSESTTTKTKKTVKFKSSNDDEKDSDDDDDDDDDDDSAYNADEQDEDNRYNVLPISHEIAFQHGTKSVTALALDPNGARLVTGGIDYEVKYWDFQGMDSTLQSFRTIRPCQSHSINHLEYNSNGELILVVSGSCIAKLVDRDGFVKAETVKGDQYITDRNNTKGHVAMLNGGTWHPMQRSLFATTSNDATCRLWDISKIQARELREHIALIKPRAKSGFFTAPNSVCFSPIGDLIALGCNDGSIQMWDTRKSYINTTHLIRPAHSQDEITSIRFSYSGNFLLSRGMDCTMKLWDVRALRNSKLSYTPGRQQYEPLHAWCDLFNRNSQTDCFFSPDDRLAITGVACDERATSDEFGRLKFFDITGGDFALQQDVRCNSRSSVIRSLWHPKLNQIVASSSDGSVRMLYDVKRSSRGALLCSFRQKRKRKDVYTSAEPQIITPHALPMFKQERRKSKFVQMIKARKDPIKSHQPEMPITGAGSGGRLASASKTFASFIAKSLGVRAKISDHEDPREALLRHAKEAEENPYWVTPAYQSTQPKAVFSDSGTANSADNRGDNDDRHGEGEEEIDESTGQRKKRKHIPV